MFSTYLSEEVHIWSADLMKFKKELSYFYSILSEDERARVNSFSFSKDQEHFIISRGILRSLLAKYLKEPAYNIEILYGLWGKPCLSEANSLRFNLSHSRNHALFAVTQLYEVGIDLEYINKALELEEIALALFSPLELHYWHKLAPENKTMSFFKMWVCKEAALKASGKGWLEKENKKFEEFLIFKKASEENIINEKITYPYCFECIPGYASALLIEGPSVQPHYFSFTLERLKTQ